jgi:hypothetical protein
MRVELQEDEASWALDESVMDFKVHLEVGEQMTPVVRAHLDLLEHSAAVAWEVAHDERWEPPRQ